MIQLIKPTQAILYGRFSPRKDSEQCQSIEVQLATCRTCCREQGYEESGVFTDPDWSGGDEERPGIWAAIAALKRGSVLVVAKSDRLARSVFLSEVIYRAVAKKRARVEVVEGSPNGESDEDVLMRHILSAFAEFERKVIAKRTRAAMLYHQSQGRMMSAAAPYGQRRGPDREVTDGRGRVKRERTLAPDPAEMAIVARVLTATAAGQKPSEIARELESDGVACRGEAWHRTTVSRIVARYQQP